MFLSCDNTFISNVSKVPIRERMKSSLYWRLTSSCVHPLNQIPTMASFGDIDELFAAAVNFDLENLRVRRRHKN